MIVRGDRDIMLETAVCKVFCSELGFHTVDRALQVMGGEGYMTENLLERLWRDSRINIIVEGANEVMHSFIFGYGAKQLGERLLALRDAPLRRPWEALRIAAELYLGIRPPEPRLQGLDPKLEPIARELEQRVAGLSHRTKLAFRRHREKLISRQLVQYRLSLAAIWLHAIACSLSRVDRTIRSGADAKKIADEVALVRHVASLGATEIDRLFGELERNADATLDAAAEVARRAAAALPNSDYVIPEKTPAAEARGSGRVPDRASIPDFGAGSTVVTEEVP
jgi:hypothetical protein